MLRGIPNCLSPDLLKVLAEMGHGDTLVIGDAFYPSASSARHSMLVRADGVRATELLDAILHFFLSIWGSLALTPKAGRG